MRDYKLLALCNCLVVIDHWHSWSDPFRNDDQNQVYFWRQQYNPKIPGDYKWEEVIAAKVPLSTLNDIRNERCKDAKFKEKLDELEKWYSDMQKKQIKKYNDHLDFLIKIGELDPSRREELFQWAFERDDVIDAIITYES